MPEWVLKLLPFLGVALALIVPWLAARRHRPPRVVARLTVATKADADALAAKVDRTARTERDVAQARRTAEARADTGVVSRADADRLLREAREWPESD